MKTVALVNANVATICGDRDDPYGIRPHTTIRVANGTILSIGEPPKATDVTIDAAGQWVTPALIDCHTHLVHGGSRAAEFEARLGGETYESIAQRGGGIRQTVKATREASEASLLQSALKRLDSLLQDGVGTIEIKSGYGLDLDTEIKMLRVARRIEDHRAVSVRTTFLGAHVVPAEYAGRTDAYVDAVCDTMLPQVAAMGLADAVDVFCESMAFSVSQTARILARAKALGLPTKLHADQRSDMGGAALAASFGALSADHLEHTSEDGVAAMAASGTVAVLLPAAFHCLQDTQRPPVAAFRSQGVPMALASDCNPGSSPCESLLVAMNLAAIHFGLTPAEAIQGVTVHAARALGLDDRGRIAPGLRADLAVWDIDHPRELTYRLGHRPLSARLLPDGTFLRVTQTSPWLLRLIETVAEPRRV